MLLRMWGFMDSIRTNLRRASWLLTCMMMLVLVLPGLAFAEAPPQKVVRVGWYEDAYNITGKNGERSGYAYEYEQAVAAYTGWKYEYVRAGWSDLLQMVETGDIDLMEGVSYTDERVKSMLFSDLPMGEEKYYMYADLTHTNISADNLASLNGKRICLLKNSIQATQFFEWEKKHNLKMQYIFVNSVEEGKKGVAKHEIDAVISTETPHWVQAGMSAIATTGGSGIYFAINKQRPDLKKELDDAMRKMEYDRPFYADELYQRYLSASSVAVLSSEEKSWLANHGAVRMGYVKNDTGFSEVDEDTGKLEGVINDYLKFVQDALGNDVLHFELVGFDTQMEEMQALKENKIDMVFHASQTPYYAEINDLILSNTLLSVTQPVVTAKNYFDENAANTVAVTRDNLAMKWYISYNYPKWNVVEYDTFAEVENAVRNGQADCFVVKYRQLTRYIEDKKLHSVFLTHPGNSAFAVTRQNTVLLSILNKTLKTMPSSLLTGALSKYDNTLKKVTMMDFVKDNVVEVTTGLTAIFIMILLLILSLLHKSKLSEAKAKVAAAESQELNEELQKSRQELEAALARAEDASAAKTNFLFNMSHDIRTPMNALLGYTKLMKDELKEPKLLEYQEKMEQSGKLLLSILNNLLDMARIESGKAELEEEYNRVGSVVKSICEVFDVEAKQKGLRLEYEVKVQHEHILCDETKVKEIFTNLLSNAVKYTPAGGRTALRTVELPSDKDGYVKMRTEVSDTGIGMSKEFLPQLFESFSRERNTMMGNVAGTGLGMSIVKKLVDMMGGTIEVESELGKGSKFSVTLEHRLADPAYYDVQDQQESETANVDKALLRGKHILMAEDNNLNAEIAVLILGKLGLRIERVEDGVQCLSRIMQQPAGTYDAILMDIQMPNMDGYKATQAIRSLPDKAKAELPIVAMTANAFEEDKQDALKAGMNGHIAKPIDVDKVEKILLAIFNK